MKLSVVVPCYNEEDNINKLQSEFFPIVERLVGSELPDGGAGAPGIGHHDLVDGA